MYGGSGQEQGREHGGSGMESGIRTEPKTYEFDAVIVKVPDTGGAYVAVPFDLRKEFGRGRTYVHVTFDGEPYDGSAVNMGIKNPDGSVCYIVGIRKEIRQKINKQPGDTVSVTLTERIR
ncbi:MAG: DUF1905 domain-containing protein [Methanomassiliicoccaceae archaeon]|nr:DUF1905 domain-containing protein [Methanomassiliicoccaceae archaeon]